jgi:3-dehydroquinate synthase class II
VAKLCEGDAVLVAEEAAGRHFGVAVEETIREN